MSKNVFEGKDLEEALHLASEKLGIAEPDLDYEILEQGRRGLFGIGAQNVRIRVMPPISPLDVHSNELLGVAPPREGGRRGGRRRRRGGNERPHPQEAADAPPRRPRREKRQQRERPPAKPKPPVPEEEVRKVEGALQEIVELMGFELTVAGESQNGGVQLTLSGADEELLAGRESELVPSLQFVLNRMARRSWPEAGRIRIGDGGRSVERDDEVIEMVREVAKQVAETGKSKRLHPMNAYERRLVHLTIRKTNGLGSRSEGDGPLKKVMIFKQDGNRGNRRRRSRRGRGRKRADG